MLLRALRALSQSHSSRNGKMEKFMPKSKNYNASPPLEEDSLKSCFVGAGFWASESQSKSWLF